MTVDLHGFSMDKEEIPMFPFQDQSLTPKERAADLLSRLTLDEKIGLLSTHNHAIERLGIAEWYIGHEIARGLVNREPENPSTVFPQPIGMAASFDKDMMREIGRTAGREARAYYNERKNGGLMVWGPTVDLSRDPRWGRNEECYGEDPCLTGAMAAQYTLGLRGDEEIFATLPTLKHFCANNHEEERGVDNASLDPRLKHEHYYTAFRTPVTEGGAHSVMTAYNEINHAPAVMNRDLNDVLKADWGLGFVVTDGGDFSQNVTAHETFPSHAQALAACLKAGADIMTDEDDCVHAAARKALDEGLLTEEDLDRAIGNMLESRVLLGHFDGGTPYDGLTREDVNTNADRALNLRAAREGMVLLDNTMGSLPLDPKKYRKIGLFGQNADVNLMDWYTGYSSYLVSIRQGLEERGCEVIYDLGWDIVKIEAPDGKFLCIGEDGGLYADTDEEHAAQFYLCQHDNKGHWTNLREVGSLRFVTFENGVIKLGRTEIYGWFTGETLHITRSRRLDGEIIADYLHGKQFTLDNGGHVVTREKARPDASVRFRLHTVSRGYGRIAAAALECDAVIYCGGNDPEQVARECYDRRSIELPGVQLDHLTELAAVLEQTEIPLIFALVSSYPYSFGEEQLKYDALVWTSHAGPELGHAFAETIFGENNPAGRLPQTWYASDEDLPDIHDYDIVKTKMTYRWFDGKALFPFGFGLSYSSFIYEEFHAKPRKDGLKLTARITNPSDRDGDEVVQFYAHALSERIARPLKQLIAFERVHVPAGETVEVTAFAPYRELYIWDVSREKFALESGEYELMAAASSEDIRKTLTLHLDGEEIPPRELTAPTPCANWDRQDGTEIYTDPLTGETHIRGRKWNNRLVFQRCDLTGVTSLTLRGASVLSTATVQISLDGNHKTTVELNLPARDGYTDFTEVSVPLTATGVHDVHIAFGQNVSLQSISIER